MSERPTVFHLIYSLKSGGAEGVLADISAALEKDGRYRPVVCAWRAGGPIEEILRSAGVDVHVLNLRRRRAWAAPLFLYDLFRIVRTLKRVIQSEDAQVVHTHLMDSTFLGEVVAARTGCPTVTTVYNNHLIPLDIPPRTLLYRFWLRLFRWSLLRCDRIVAVSPTVVETLHATAGIPRQRMTVATNGVSIDTSTDELDPAGARRGLGIDANAPTIVFVGRLVPNKNQAALIDMMPTVLAEHPEARLLLVGEGPTESDLRDQVRRLRVEHAVVFAGYSSEVSSILASASTFVTASVSEGISFAVLEAMAAEVPVVATRCIGNEETLSGGAGLLVDEAAPTELAAAVSKVLSDTKLAATLGAAGRQRVVERYRFDRTLDQMIGIYDELAHSPASAGR